MIFLLLVLFFYFLIFLILLYPLVLLSADVLFVANQNDDVHIAYIDIPGVETSTTSVLFAGTNGATLRNSRTSLGFDLHVLFGGIIWLPPKS